MTMTTGNDTMQPFGFAGKGCVEKRFSFCITCRMGSKVYRLFSFQYDINFGLNTGLQDIFHYITSERSSQNCTQASSTPLSHRVVCSSVVCCRVVCRSVWLCRGSSVLMAQIHCLLIKGNKLALEVPDSKSWSCDGWRLSDKIFLVRITWYQDKEIVKYSASRRILQPNLWLWGQITCDPHAFYQSQRCGRIKFLKWLDTIKKKIQTSLPPSIDTGVSWKSSPTSEWKAGPMTIRAKRPSMHARKNRWKGCQLPDQLCWCKCASATRKTAELPRL